MAKKDKRSSGRGAPDENPAWQGTGPLLGFAHQTYHQRVVDKMTARGYQGVRASHLTVFRLMDPAGSRSTTLARNAGVTKQAMGQLVRELEQLGYLSLSADDRDGRAKLAVYTESGTRLARDSAECLGEVHQEFKRALGKGGMKELRKLLAKLRDAFAD